jgi:hypothetical protein
MWNHTKKNAEVDVLDEDERMMFCEGPGKRR